MDQLCICIYYYYYFLKAENLCSPLWLTWLYLQPSVDIKTVLSQLMDRLSNYAASSTEVSVVHLSLKLNSHLLLISYISQVLPEFLQVEAFIKLSTAISRVSRLFSSSQLSLNVFYENKRKKVDKTMDNIRNKIGWFFLTNVFSLHD